MPTGIKKTLTDREQQWQKALDAAAYFNSLVVPDPAHASTAIAMPGASSKLAGAKVHGLGHRFDVALATLSACEGVRAANVVGEVQLALDFKWQLIPDDFGVFPGREPPPTAFDPTRSQRFALMDATFDFGGGNRLWSIGAGRTFPLALPGAPGRVALAGIAGVLEGSGSFGDTPQGCWVVSGFFTPPNDFQLELLLRLQDNAGNLQTQELPPIHPIPNPVVGTTYLAVRTSAWPQTTDVRFGPDKQPTGLTTWETMTRIDTAFVAGGPRGPVSRVDIGPEIGQHYVDIQFLGGPTNLGTAASPIPFVDREEFIFHDASGGFVGSFTAPVMDGRSWFAKVPGVPDEIGIQLASGFALITGGKGCFAGASGIVTNVGIGTFVPHLTTLVYMAQLADPTGQYRA